MKVLTLTYNTPYTLVKKHKKIDKCAKIYVQM